MYISSILFDLHHTLTELTESIVSVVRRVSRDNGIDLSSFDDNRMEEAFLVSDTAMKNYQINNNVNPLWGAQPEDWVPFDRIMFEELGITGLSDEVIITIDTQFQSEVRSDEFEWFTEDALHTIQTLHERGYTMGICTRRNHDPNSLLINAGVRGLFDSVQWSGVTGYEKPSPYTLLNAAREIGVNPRKCAFVGNYVNADIEAAVRCEMLPVLLTWANPHEGPKAPEGTLVFEMPSEILQVFESPSVEFSMG